MTQIDAHGYLHLEVNQKGEARFRDYETYDCTHDIGEDMDEDMAKAIYAQIGDVKDCLVLVTFTLTYETSYNWEYGRHELDAVVPTVLSHTVVVDGYKEFMRRQITKISDWSEMSNMEQADWEEFHDEDFTPPEKKTEQPQGIFFDLL